MTNYADAGVREKIARVIQPGAWRAFDATLRPFAENRGAMEGEQFWHVRAYQAGCRTERAAYYWWHTDADSDVEPVQIQLFRESLHQADTILAALALPQSAEAGVVEAARHHIAYLRSFDSQPLPRSVEIMEGLLAALSRLPAAQGEASDA